MKLRATYFAIIIFLVLHITASAQINQIQNRISSLGNMGTGKTSEGKLKIENRPLDENKIAISYKLLSNSQKNFLDSTINDFSHYFPIPANNIYLGNLGSASRSLLFSPSLNCDIDFGLHAFDIYKLSIDKAKLFTTSRPFTELAYMLGSNTEQMIKVLHTQNVKPNWNVAFLFQLISSPGAIQNLANNHSNLQLTSNFQSKNKRYFNDVVILTNKIRAGENGGIKSIELDTVNLTGFNPLYSVNTHIGSNSKYSGNPFLSSNFSTGHKYTDKYVMMRQRYDFGKKDSIVTDTSIIQLYNPRFRIEYSFEYQQNEFSFVDYNADSAYYRDNYSIKFNRKKDTIIKFDNWKNIKNEFAVYQFPDLKNQQQYIRLAISSQNLTGNFTNKKNNFFLLIGSVGYENKTKNKKWDLSLNGNLNLAGYQFGNYSVSGKLERFINRKFGSVRLEFENVNRKPSFIFDTLSSFYLDPNKRVLKNINFTRAGMAVLNLEKYFSANFNWYVFTNYVSVKNNYEVDQNLKLNHVMQLSLSKRIKISRHWDWYNDIHFQLSSPNSPVRVPAVFMRERIAYEGNFFKNLILSTGLELKYFSPYYADAYAPIQGVFASQQNQKIEEKLPDISAYLDLRINGFKLFFRADNLNSARINQGLNFTNVNFVAPDYIMPGLQIRLGIFWAFIN